MSVMLQRWEHREIREAVAGVMLDIPVISMIKINKAIVCA